MEEGSGVIMVVEGPECAVGGVGTLKDAIAAKERAENYKRLLHELVANGLFEMEDGQVRIAETESERLDMRAKLLGAGHDLDSATRSLAKIVETASSKHLCVEGGDGEGWEGGEGGENAEDVEDEDESEA